MLSSKFLFIYLPPKTETIMLMNPLEVIQHYLFLALFCGVATLALIASAYLLLRPHNIFSNEINPPVRLRRWAAVCLAFAGISHINWLLVYHADTGISPLNSFIICTTFDAVFSLPTLLCTMVIMLQDRRRPLWPVTIVVGLVLILLLQVYVNDSRGANVVIVMAVVIFVIVSIALMHMLKQYERWLQNNYADLEHKEVRQTYAIVAGFLLMCIAYDLASDYVFVEVFLELLDSVFIFLIVWRVETLQTLEETDEEEQNIPNEADPMYKKITSLLQEHCIDTQYYLRPDATLSQLANIIGTNTTYLSQHFACQGISYNRYINNMRIEHFMRLYEESVRNQQSVTAAKLAIQSGFRSYSTFSYAFKQIKEKSVKQWMEEFTSDQCVHTKAEGV